MYGEGQDSKSATTITEQLVRANRGLASIDAILDGRDGDVEKAQPPSLRPAMPADELVDQVRKQTDDIVTHIEGLLPRLRKIVRSL